MITSLAQWIVARFGWQWKPSSLEMIFVRCACPGTIFTVPIPSGILKCKIVFSMIALGGMWDANGLNVAMIRYRLAKGDKCIYKYGKHPLSKQPFQIKLSAFTGSPRLSASYLLSMRYENLRCLHEIARWE
ncbi:unnamed protein product [Prorocentrum cordatum]|uniref:Uncharacterized protein n=1 Tax=Prorocentrum cordatum TaxID=2364126 RepID=A0ABN9UBH6_9DINO|nr:unnamed protein product [Polarella glacialis]